MFSRPWSRPVLGAGIGALVLLASAGCGNSRRALQGQASDVWSRTYRMQPGGELQIVGGNGDIDVKAGSGPDVEVQANRTVHATSDAMAKALVPGLRIREDVGSDRVVLQTLGLDGIVVGVSTEVNYHVVVPARTHVRLRSASGEITASGLDGPVVASTTSGSITATALRGGVDARTTNGQIAIDMAAIGSDPVQATATNGGISLTLPPGANANLAATCTNGAIDVADLPVEMTGEQARRRYRGRLNQGGTAIELTTISGDIHVRPRP